MLFRQSKLLTKPYTKTHFQITSHPLHVVLLVLGASGMVTINTVNFFIYFLVENGVDDGISS